MAHDVFISYSAKNKATGDAVCATLESSGIRCWIAPRDVVPGMEWSECIIEAIEQARVMVLIFTADANASPQIRREVERAVNRGVAILPLRIENVMPGRALEYFIGNVHWLDALTPPFEAHLKNLAGTVKLLLDRMQPREAEPRSHRAAEEEAQVRKPPRQTMAPSPEAADVSRAPHPIEAALGEMETASSAIVPEIGPEPAGGSSTKTVNTAGVYAPAKILNSGYSHASAWGTDPSPLSPQQAPSRYRSNVAAPPATKTRNSRVPMFVILGIAIVLVALFAFFETRNTWTAHFIKGAGWLFSISGTSDGRYLWAVGENGTIFASDDLGANWEARPSGTNATLYSIFGAGDGRRLWVVGDQGTVLESDDGSLTWVARKSDTTSALFSIFGTSDGKHLWAVGSWGALVESDDGGENWTWRKVGTRRDLRSISGTSDGKRLWIAGGWGTILESDDGGASWKARQEENQTSFHSVYGTCDGKQVSVGGWFGTIVQSSDGGATWTWRKIDNVPEFNSVLGTSDCKRLWAVGENGTIAESDDGGASWTTRNDGNRAPLNSIFVTADGKLRWAVGGNGILAKSGQ